MLIPQFTTRQMMLGMTGASAFCLVLWFAVWQKQAWAMAVALSAGSLVLTLIVGMVMFQLSYLLARMLGLLRPPEKPQSPFATDAPPPQLVRPGGAE